MLGASVVDLFTSGKNKKKFNDGTRELRAERPEEAESDVQSEGEIVYQSFDCI